MTSERIWMPSAVMKLWTCPISKSDPMQWTHHSVFPAEKNILMDGHWMTITKAGSLSIGRTFDNSWPNSSSLFGVKRTRLVQLIYKAGSSTENNFVDIFIDRPLRSLFCFCLVSPNTFPTVRSWTSLEWPAWSTGKKWTAPSVNGGTPKSWNLKDIVWG